MGALAFGFAPTLNTILRRPSSFLRRSSASRYRPVRTRTFRYPKCTVAPSPDRTSPLPSVSSETQAPLTFQDAVLRLQQYWISKGCVVWHPYNHEVGAGTMNPATFLRVLGPEPWSVAYDEPSIRPDDSRYGENPNRLQRHTQFQVIVKPAPDCAQELVVGSYHALGIDTCKHDIRFVEDNWESPALGAWGLGWEVWLDGMEVTQFTYFQQAGGMPLDSVAVEITYGMERIIMALQGKQHFKDIIFAPGITYGEIFTQNEREMSVYNLDVADVERNNQMFDIYEREANMLLEKRLPVPAYNYLLKASHTFNVLDARGAIGVTERARYFQRMRALARNVATLWLESREELGFPLLSANASPDTESTESRASSQVLKSDSEDLVLEIGVEELPSTDVAGAIAQIQKLLNQILREAHLSFSSVDVTGTPRRVTAYVRDLQTRQKDEVKRIRGPPLRVALNDGKPTKAATGFMRSQGIDDENSVEYNEEEGYMYATVQKSGQAALDVLGEAFATSLFGKLSFRKTMRWNGSGVSFSRPIRWLLCLLGDQVVPFKYAGVTSSNTTRSLRGSDGFAADVVIKSASEYHQVMRELQIVLSGENRAAHIRKEAARLAAEIRGNVPQNYLEGDLLSEVTDLVENPIPLLGRFDPCFLNLPEEVLVTVMKKHQRYFPVVDASTGALLSGFITVANGDANLTNIDAIRQGNEAVLRARYSDAAFFYEKDTEDKQLSDFVPKLSGLMFQEKLGSMLDKVNRVKLIVPKICGLLHVSGRDSDIANLTAQLYKADLATSMVVEMTSLAGTMGRHYALKSEDVPSEVAQAIFEAALPRFSGDDIATSTAGAIVAVADRLDSLVSLFTVGLMPKSTADPFALRRAALGVVQTLLENDFDLDLSDVVRLAAQVLDSESQVPVSSNTSGVVVDFISKRLEGYLLDVRRFPDDVVKAVLAVPRNSRSSVAAVRLCESLVDQQQNNAEKLSKAEETYSRASRLLKSLKDVSTEELSKTSVQEDLFDCKEEHYLWDSLKALNVDVEYSSSNYSDVITRKVEQLCEIKHSVDSFFDNVFVNAENQAVRKNRLVLCSRIVNIMASMCDMSFLRTV
ncbi:Glycine--tRNA ligase, chloroplastic/mitochondrial 2 [Gracilariopsis chorda]|uniref:glycine--tRNA ligase n=1 Tax=Gracilariopsis chorda TaxID=448386 RepID=A0A2V3IYI5_9FLOR|nr:Glycine--tRNA ligase, chloroplastic/mitochondrial 2 [Gracilariopsis chorda]|eukprot:PXF47169.1 Glycine--tRNA ligase, chloroplastic/mitochondrial 2 [Gracilariopsis chorda]